MQRPVTPIELFFSYAQEDELLNKELLKHLVLLRRQKIITSWHHRLVDPGTDWTQAMDERIEHASIILLLVSPDFISSDYCYGVEMERAMEQFKKRQARVIPILLRPALWKETPFGNLQPLPTNGQPITSWTDRDAAFLNVAAGIYQALEKAAHPDDALSPVARAALKSSAGHAVLGDIDITIGREPDNTYMIRDLEVSRHHALIRKDGQEYAIFDRKSKNGTFVNGHKLSPLKAHVLNEGDLIRINTTTFEYSDNILVESAEVTRTRGESDGVETKHLPENQQEAKQEAFPTGVHEAPEQTMINHRYRLMKRVGQGGMGMVYLAQDTQKENRLVAVKEMSVSRLTSQEISRAVEQFQHEADVLATLNHPNLPVIYESFGENDRWYLVMSFIEGQNLHTTLNTAPGNRLPVGETIRIGIELCRILEYLHTHNPQIIFRDLKPANIMITPQLHIYLIDFGIARHFKWEQTKDTTSFASVGYAPPEQYGQSQTTPRSDIFSLGATLHQMLSGRNPTDKPFQFSNLLLVDQTILKPLAGLIAQMLEMDAKARPVSAAEVRERLEEILASLSQKSDRAPASIQVPKPNEQPLLESDPSDVRITQMLAPQDSVQANNNSFEDDLLKLPPKRPAAFSPARRSITRSFPNEYELEYGYIDPDGDDVGWSQRPSSIRRPSSIGRSSRQSRQLTQALTTTQTSPRVSRSSIEAFPPTQTAPAFPSRSPTITRRSPPSPVQRHSFSASVRRRPSSGRALFWIIVGLLLGVLLLLACRLWWPAVWHWLLSLVTH